MLKGDHNSSASQSDHPAASESCAPLLTWLHLSDVHFGHADPAHDWNQAHVISELQHDVARMTSRGAPAPDIIAVTGDIAYKAKSDDYARATEWLLDIARSLKIGPEKVLTVPGNHDVQRFIDDESLATRVLMNDLRKESSQLDNVMNPTHSDHKVLEARLANYLQFARSFGSGGSLYWVKTIDESGIPIRFIGMNTAILSMNDEDREKLRVGQRQLAHLLDHRDRNWLNVVLSHHPTDWLADEREVATRIKHAAQIHISGHVHEASSEEIRGGGSDGYLIRVVAGAVHGDRLPPGVPASHGYNISSVVRAQDGSVRLRVWPRRWSTRHQSFRLDAENATDGYSYAEHRLSYSTPAPSKISPQMVEILESGLGPRLLHFVGLYRHGKSLLTKNCVNEIPEAWAQKIASFDRQLELYDAVGARTDAWVRDLNNKLRHLDQGKLIRTVFDVEEGGVFHFYLKDGYYLVGATIIQEDMDVCDSRMREMQEKALLELGGKSVTDPARVVPD